MWDEQKSRRFQDLRQRQLEGRLSEEEQADLSQLVKELEAAEAAYLAPTTQRVRQERESLEEQNRCLEALIRRKEDLVRRLRDFLAETQAERQAIARELTAVLAGGRGADTDE